MRRAALTLLLWGCGSGGAGHAALVVANRGGYARARLESSVLQSYLEIHPGLRVVQQHPSSEPRAYRRRLLDAIQAGTPPDALLLDGGDVQALADRGALLDLGPYLARVGVTLTDYDSTVLSAFRRGTAVYALPTGFSTLVVAYNKDLFDRAALSAPSDDWTWDDFSAMAKRLTRDRDGDGTVDQWGTTTDQRVAYWLAWVWAGGGDVLCSDGKRATGCLDSPNTIAALHWYADWVDPDPIAPPPGGPQDGMERFLGGSVAMLTVGHAAIPRLRSRAAAGGFRIGFAPIPHRAGFPPVTLLCATGYAVPALALRRKLAVELVASLADSLAGRVRGQTGLEVPAITSVAAALAAADTLGWEAAFLTATASGRLPWDARVPRWGEVETALAGLMDRLIRARADPEAAAHDMALHLDRVLAAPR